MVSCIHCASAIDENGQCYSVENMGPDIFNIIENNLGRLIEDNGVICSECFSSILQQLNDTNVCVWCRSSLLHTPTHFLLEGLERTVISERISPREVPEGGRVCGNCWSDTREILQERGVVAQSSANLSSCVWCNRSLARTRVHSIPEGPERNNILARIHPREIPDGGMVCYACWVAARRNVQMAANIENMANSGPSTDRHHNRSCAWCGLSLFRQHCFHLSNGPERDEVAASIYPRELPEHCVLCSNCWSQVQENINIEVGVMRPSSSNPCINLDGFYHTTNDESRCFVPFCTNTERLRVPEYIRKKILKSQKLYVTEHTRICVEHKSVYNWDFLDQHDFSSVFSKSEIEGMMNLCLLETKTTLDFENIHDIEDSIFKYWTGVTKDGYSNILNNISPALTCKSRKTALGIYLIKVRTGDSHERISSLLSLSKASVARLLKVAREALLRLFVPLHLGISHISREEFLNRNLLIPEGLFGNREERKAIVICDGTYVYVQKSSNYLFQKRSYSLHKYRNLVKPFLMVVTDGHILDVCGPYAATESDASIMKALFQNENGELRAYFTPGDAFILDRGFRDAIPFLGGLGYEIYKPESRERGERQLSTLKANKSRCVTLCRWVVEVVNGRFKRDFKLFRQEYFNTAATHLMDDFRICAALINAFHPVITDRPDAQILLSRALDRMNMPNVLSVLVESNRINRSRTQFTRIDTQLPELDIFPVMTMSELIIFGLGIYHIKQARSYYGEHIRQHGSFQVEISNNLEVVSELMPSQQDSILIRGRIKSRHQSRKVYYTYIMLARQAVSWDGMISGYYCSCIAGKRTIGCCAHVMTIVWYLGWARHQTNIEAPASVLDGILIREDDYSKKIK